LLLQAFSSQAVKQGCNLQVAACMHGLCTMVVEREASGPRAGFPNRWEPVWSAGSRSYRESGQTQEFGLLTGLPPVFFVQLNGPGSVWGTLVRSAESLTVGSRIVIWLLFNLKSSMTQKYKNIYTVYIYIPYIVCVRLVE
jgi:hypothetical protein